MSSVSLFDVFAQSPQWAEQAAATAAFLSPLTEEVAMNHIYLTAIAVEHSKSNFQCARCWRSLDVWSAQCGTLLCRECKMQVLRRNMRRLRAMVGIVGATLCVMALGILTWVLF